MVANEALFHITLPDKLTLHILWWDFEVTETNLILHNITMDLEIRDREVREMKQMLEKHQKDIDKLVLLSRNQVRIVQITYDIVWHCVMRNGNNFMFK